LSRKNEDHEKKQNGHTGSRRSQDVLQMQQIAKTLI
jgi:hypothetical protein